jgi:transcriptional regulator with XRE-family HTH domain
VQKPKPPLSAWLIHQRKERGWKPLDVAQRLDVAEVTVRGWESGRSIRADTVGELERLFGVTAPGSALPPQQAELGVLLPLLERQALAAERQADAAEALLRLLTGQPAEGQQTANFRDALRRAGALGSGTSTPPTSGRR